jgi:nucleotide-binding universal stress UspA family protein
VIGKILVAVDGSPAATRALTLGADIALRYGARLHVVHVMTEVSVPEGFEEFARIERLDPPLWAELGRVGDEILAAARADATAKGVRDVRTLVLTGDPAEQLLRYAHDHGVDLIVLGRRGLGRVQGLLMGSVSVKVSSLAECPVVTVK